MRYPVVVHKDPQRDYGVSVPERVLSLIDTYAAGRSESRSGLIAEAMIEYIAAHSRGE